MVNWTGVGGSISAIINPKILIPRLIIPDISHLDWLALKNNGVNGIVIDKDNCITKPGQDTLVPSLKPSWDTLLRTFGSANVLIVSNSAGTNKDSLLLQAESVSRNLQVPVLVHPTMKPGKECAISTARYFSSLPSPSPPSPFITFLKRTLRIKSKPPLGAVVWNNRIRSQALYPTPSSSSFPSSTSILTSSDTSSFSNSLPHQVLLVIGDRLATDMILSSRLSSLSNSTAYRIRAIPILTTTLHSPEGLGTTILRSIEKLVLRLLRDRESTIRFQSEGPWNDCLLPTISPSPLPSPPSPSSTSNSYSISMKILQFIITQSNKLKESYNYQTEWNWTKKTSELYKGSRGIEFWAEKLVDGTENVVQVEKRRLSEVLKKIGIRS